MKILIDVDFILYFYSHFVFWRWKATQSLSMRQFLWRCNYDVFESVWKSTKTSRCKKTTGNITTNNSLLNFSIKTWGSFSDLHLTIEVMVSTHVTHKLQTHSNHLWLTTAVQMSLWCNVFYVPIQNFCVLFPCSK